MRIFIIIIFLMVVQVHDKNTKRSITIQILLLAVQHIVHDGLLVVESFAFFRVSAVMPTFFWLSKSIFAGSKR